MSDVILVINAGSSSIKFTVYDVQGSDLTMRYDGQIEGIGTAPHFEAEDRNKETIHDETWSAESNGRSGHTIALAKLLGWLNSKLEGSNLIGVGHRVVHGGAEYTAPVVITDEVLQTLEGYVVLAPLHQPNSLAGINAVKELQPDLPQVACFDTSFHRTNPLVAEQFAIPYEFFEEGVRRYGFHGLSYAYIAHTLPTIAPDIANGRVVVAHLGSGASVAAINNGKGVDSTMGFTALDGLPMGTRCGSIDPGVLLYWLQEKGMDAHQIENMLYKKSGLLGLSGISNDMRDLENSDDPRAAQAIDYFVYRVVWSIGALAAVNGGMDALVFTAGIGEHSETVRGKVVQKLTWMGIELNEEANDRDAGLITTPESPIPVYVIPTDEEMMIAMETLKTLQG